MAGSKKKTDESTKNKRSKKIEELIVDDNEVSDKKSSKYKDKKNKKLTNEEDELSDLDLDDNDLAEPETNDDNDAIIDNSKIKKNERILIDPKTQIGKLRPDEILSYLIQLGGETLNPQLKYGALNLLRQLSGKRRNNQMNSGSKRGGNYQPRNNFSRNQNHYYNSYNERQNRTFNERQNTFNNDRQRNTYNQDIYKDYDKKN